MNPKKVLLLLLALATGALSGQAEHCWRKGTLMFLFKYAFLHINVKDVYEPPSELFPLDVFLENSMCPCGAAIAVLHIL